MMKRNQLFRGVLWLAAGFNVFAAFLLAFPASAMGQAAGLPSAVPAAYRAVVAVFVLQFAGAYAWLARQSEPLRPMVAFSTIGKASVFLVTVGLWLLSEASIKTVLFASGDLLFVGLFVRWLVTVPEKTQGSP